MKSHPLFYHLATIVTLAAMLLPQGGAILARSERAGLPAGTQRRPAETHHSVSLPFGENLGQFEVEAPLQGQGTGSPSPSRHPASAPYAGWEEVGTGSATGGGISDNSGLSGVSSTAIAPDGTPYVAWGDDSSGNSELYIRRWNGSSWSEVGTGSATGGGISNDSGGSGRPSVAIAPDGTPYVTWESRDSIETWKTEIYVRRWNGSSWEEVGANSAGGGGISNTAGGEYPSIAVAPDGTPYAAWADDSSGDYEIYVRRWNGSSWGEVGTGSAGGTGISNSGNAQSPSVVIAPDGTPYVVWDDYTGASPEIYVRRWNGSSWEEVGTGSATGGGISNNSGYSQSHSTAIAPDGTPYVAWHDNSSGKFEIYVRRWNGSSWSEIGAGSATGGGISNNGNDSRTPSIAIASDGTPYVAWRDNSDGDYEIYVRRWNGSSWEEVGAGSATGGGISNDSDVSASPVVAVAPNNTPYLAWENKFEGNYEIYVLRWNGSSWEEVGAGSAGGGGISNHSGYSRGATMAVAPDGTPYIAWYNYFSGTMISIYIRRWNGSSWEEVGVGSADGGGISKNGGSSKRPSIAIAPDGIPYVAWQDESYGDYEIYVRRWIE